MPVEEYTGVGRCLERTYHKALKAWRERWHRDEDLPTAVALHCTKVVCYSVMLRGGALEVQCEVQGDDDKKNATCVSYYTRRSLGKWRVKGEDTIRIV